MLRHIFRRSSDPNPIDEQIKAVLAEMTIHTPDSPEYKEMLDHLDKLTKLKKLQVSEPLSKDTIAIIFGNLAIAAVIIIYENKHVLNTKALNQMSKPR